MISFWYLLLGAGPYPGVEQEGKSCCWCDRGAHPSGRRYVLSWKMRTLICLVCCLDFQWLVPNSALFSIDIRYLSLFDKGAIFFFFFSTGDHHATPAFFQELQSITKEVSSLLFFFLFFFYFIAPTYLCVSNKCDTKIFTDFTTARPLQQSNDAEF